MNKNLNGDTLYRWSFTISGEHPGPSEGDALEFIEDLGFKPSAFARLAFGGEVTCGKTVIAQFEIIGSQELIESLRTVHDRYIRSTTPLPVALNSWSGD